MKCPKCKAELPLDVLHRDCERFCIHCDFFPHDLKKRFQGHVEAKYCLRVQNGEIAEAEFNVFECDDCIGEACILATAYLEDIGMIQDEEGNWVYHEDLDDDETDDF